jgi:hypothetical protein
MYPATPSHFSFGLIVVLAVLALPVIAAWLKALKKQGPLPSNDFIWLGVMTAVTVALSVAIVDAQKPNPFALGGPAMLMGVPAMSPQMPSLMGTGVPQIDPTDLLKQLQP